MALGIYQEIFENAQSEGIGMKLGEKNKHNS